jgi:hypothetical protein
MRPAWAAIGLASVTATGCAALDPSGTWTEAWQETKNAMNPRSGGVSAKAREIDGSLEYGSHESFTGPTFDRRDDDFSRLPVE